MTGPRALRLAEGLLWGAVGARLLVSSYLLLELGIRYQVPGGGFLVKLHPGTYLLLLAFLALLAGERANPLGVVMGMLRARPGIALYAAATLAFLGYSGLRYGPSGAAFIIDTLLTPALAVMILDRLGQAAARRLLALLVAFIVVNSLVALGEAVTHRRLLPLVSEGVPLYIDPFRASALIGHPLQNSIHTATNMFIVLAAGWRAGVRWALVTLMMLALLTFGSRAALFTTVIALALYAAMTAAELAARRRLSYLGITGGLALIGLALPVFAVVVVEYELGERILRHLRWDDSAEVRLASLSAFDLITPEQLLFGISPQSIATLLHRLNIDPNFEAIENPWVLLILQMGLVMFVPFVMALLGFVWSIGRGAPLAAKISLAVFLIIASTNNSFAGKSPVLLIQFLAVAAVRRAAEVNPDSRAADGRAWPAPFAPGLGGRAG